ncbi:hypothetical protein GGP41_005148 [Bipolaris sorokiniana]|uniref:DRBM domain-containing protein n=3 Tax=Bipolaris TaxID=33194 RepID=A0A8H5ZK28_COCSA|nr:uncharacterized protein COCSADRAFT_337876 [Bipolaris sorokiniana ND90Pr]XP_007714705.1 uncharacterized protein COCCADRAFT_7064 [Bipolaris zeicola 26-R-13]EMD63124.1 hypothetical protein COCSADRAFT_337876 [Bipolaris sorokiniana ND90Pr]EUC30991.1 hypothetical protein COCCADRAFT_7064 [Bipolaris zeicola 26-R-13]KAF5849679.1 hypothetical protein GGP41_005148 [Bipolaris sorokiniana]
MTSPDSWSQRLREHCLVRGIPEPTYTDLSDRRGGRTAWTTMVSVSGTNYQARFWYDGDYLSQAKEDCSEVALRTITGYVNSAQTPPPASHYRSLGTQMNQSITS